MPSKSGKRGVSKLPEVPEARNPVGIPEPAKAVWDELTRLGERISKGWPKGVTSADVLSEMRR